MNFRRSRLLALVATSIPVALLLSGSADATDPPVTQQGILVGQKPVSGRYALNFKDFEEKGCADFHCSRQYYKAAAGTFKTKLSTYKIKDGLKGYDFYLLTVDTNVGHRGESVRGGATITDYDIDVSHEVDYADSPTMTATDGGCQTVDFSLGYSFGPIGASTNLASFNFCDENATGKLSHSGVTAFYKLYRLAKINNVTLSRVEKVKSGTHPTFRVAFYVHQDTCTKGGKLVTGKYVCFSYAGNIVQKRYSIGTTG